MNFLRHYAILGNRNVDSGSKQVVTVLKRLGNGWKGGAAIMFGAIQNMGTIKFRFAVNQSDDNGAIDAYAAINLRVRGADVAYVDVVPGATVEFSIEYVSAFAHAQYLEFTATPSTGNGVAQGTLGLVYRDEATVEFLETRNSVGV